MQPSCRFPSSEPVQALCVKVRGALSTKHGIESISASRHGISVCFSSFRF